MGPEPTHPLVHLELHTGDLAGARAFYASCAAGGRRRSAARGRSYLALGLGAAVGGGIVECGTPRSMWLPYVAVDDVAEVTAHARRLGASVLLGRAKAPRDGAAWSRRRPAARSPSGSPKSITTEPEAGRRPGLTAQHSFAYAYRKP